MITAIIKDAWSRIFLTFIVLVGGFVLWLISLLIFAATMFLIVPLIWVVVMIVILIRGLR